MASKEKGNEKEEYMKNPEREDGSPAERPLRDRRAEGRFRGLRGEGSSSARVCPIQL